MKFSLNKILAVAVIILSLLAALAGNPFSSKKSFITPEELADSLISKKQNLRIVDLRKSEDFSEYHLPSAINSSPNSTSTTLFNKNDMIVLYSGKDNISTTVQYKFEEAGFKEAYFLKDGIDGWMNNVLFPIIPQNSSSKEDFKKIERRSRYFGGAPESSGETKNKVYRREGC